MQKRLHIIISSRLHSNGGGCETWLNYFLKGLETERYFSDVLVYHITPVDYCNSVCKNFDKSTIVNFVSINIPDGGNGTGVKTIYKYSKFVIFQLYRNLVNHDTVICIGSTFVAFIGIAIRIGVFTRRVKIVTWLRSIAVEELRIRSPKISVLAFFLEYLLLMLSNKVIANGIDTFEYYTRKYKWVKKKISTVENALPSERFVIKDAPNFTANKITIAYMGRFSRAKGFGDFLESVASYQKIIQKHKQEVEFHIYGHGSDFSLENLDIINHGSYSPMDTLAILKKHHAVIFLNRTGVAAGLSHSLLETMAAKRLIIAWDNKIHRQILDENNSILVPEGNIQKLVDLYNWLSNMQVNDINAINDKCSNAQRKAKSYDVDAHMDKFYRAINIELHRREIDTDGSHDNSSRS